VSKTERYDESSLGNANRQIKCRDEHDWIFSCRSAICTLVARSSVFDHFMGHRQIAEWLIVSAQKRGHPKTDNLLVILKKEVSSVEERRCFLSLEGVSASNPEYSCYQNNSNMTSSPA
jgi:hypothetical protein